MQFILRQPYSFSQLGKRANQEDARFPDEDAPRGCHAAFVVCDGVGGQERGEVASRVVADTIGRAMRDFDPPKPFTAADFEQVLAKVYREIDVASQHAKLEMATTLTFLCFHSGGAFIAHIGDSRIYHVRPSVGIMHQTDDHSLVNALVHSGNITPEEAINHPQSNIITRCIRPSKSGQTDTADTLQIRDIEPGDYFFLCSDGVLHQLPDERLFAILSADTPDREKIETIAALSADSSDNNTAYLIGVDDVVYDPEETGTSGAGDTAPDDSATTPIGVPNDEIIRAEAARKQSLGENISNFFKKLF